MKTAILILLSVLTASVVGQPLGTLDLPKYRYIDPETGQMITSINPPRKYDYKVIGNNNGVIMVEIIGKKVKDPHDTHTGAFSNQGRVRSSSGVEAMQITPEKHETHHQKNPVPTSPIIAPTPLPKPTTAIAADANTIVNLINAMYGNVCHAEINGFFSKTLKLDWTANTRKIHAIKIMAEIGNLKAKLYEDGVRYFQFPNNAGMYNVIDWKTGEKKSITEQTQYYFSD